MYGFQNLYIPIKNKSARVTTTNATLVDHILTNSFLYDDKGDISDLFPIFLYQMNKLLTMLKKDNRYKTTLTNPNQVYEFFLRLFLGIYNHAHSLKEVTVNGKTI